MHRSHSLGTAACGLVVLLTSAAHATEYTWTGNGDQRWENAVNWQPTGYPGLDPGNDIAIINDVSNQNTITLSTAVSIARLTIDHPEAELELGTDLPASLTLTGGASVNRGLITVADDGGEPTIHGTLTNDAEGEIHLAPNRRLFVQRIQNYGSPSTVHVRRDAVLRVDTYHNESVTTLGSGGKMTVEGGDYRQSDGMTSIWLDAELDLGGDRIAIIEEGILEGRGERGLIRGSLEVQWGGWVRVTMGALTVTGSYEQQSGARLLAFLGDYCRAGVAVGEDVSLAGELFLFLVDYTYGNPCAVLTFDGGRDGEFDDIESSTGHECTVEYNLQDVTVIVEPAWRDGFDGYQPGPLLPQDPNGGWAAWDDDPGAAEFVVTSDQFRSEPYSLAIDGADDAVHEFDGHTTGLWTLTAWQFVPWDLEQQQYFILLNTYESNGPQNYSLQLLVDGAAGEISDDDPRNNFALPLQRARWTEIKVEIDLDADLQNVYYAGELLVSKSWTDGMSEGGELNIAAVDLYGNESEIAIYYDDLSLRQGPCTGDVNGDGFIGFRDLVQVLASWGPCGDCNDCPADVDGDCNVGFDDLLLILAYWGTC